MKTKVYPCNYTDDLEKECSSEVSAVGIEEMSITYVQPADTCSNSDEIQNLTITTRCGDSVGIGEEGWFFGEMEKAIMDAFHQQGFKFDKGYSTGYRQTDHHYICTELGLSYSVDSGD